MSIYRFTRSTTDGDLLLSAENPIEAGAGYKIDEEFAIGTHTPVALAFAVAKLKGFALLSDVDMTLKTNSSGSPQETISLVAGKPLQWDESQAPFIPNPFAGNVTGLYVTNAAAGTLQGLFAIDPT